MFTLILTALFASAYGEFCNPSKFSGMILNATSGVSFKFAIVFNKNVSYLGDVDRNNFLFTNATSGKDYTFNSGSCQGKNTSAASRLSRCLPPGVKLSAGKYIGGGREKLRLFSYKYTNDCGDEVVETFSSKRRNRVLFATSINGMHYVLYNTRAMENLSAYLNHNVSDCS